MGKSSITTQLALSLCLQGFSVGILDADLTGPSIPRFLGVEDAKVTQAPGGWLPVMIHPATSSKDVSASTNPTKGSVQTEDIQETPEIAGAENISRAIGSLHALSLALLLPSRSTAVIWRGPKKTAMIRQLLSSIHWGKLDYLLIDTPPGTSDEHISLAETLLDPQNNMLNAATGRRKLAGAVVVTTPQAVATSDVKKELNFCRKTGIHVLGIVENMSGYICPCCGEATALFGKGGGEAMAHEWNERFLGRVPVDGRWVDLIETGKWEGYQEPEAPASTTTIEAAPKEEVGESSSEELLIHKYSKCALYPIMSSVAQDVVRQINGHDDGRGKTTDSLE